MSKENQKEEITPTEKFLVEAESYFQYQIILMSELFEIIKGKVKSEEESRELSRFNMIYPLLERMISSAESVQIMCRVPKPVEAYIVARAFLEQITNFCYLMVCNANDFNSYIEYGVQKSIRSKQFKAKNMGVIINKEIENNIENPGLKDILDRFTGKNGGEKRRWTNKNLQNRIEEINCKIEDFNGGVYANAALLVYEDASEVLHGNYYGFLLTNKLFHGESEAQKKESYYLMTGLLFSGLGVLVPEMLKIVSRIMPIKPIMEKSECSYKKHTEAYLRLLREDAKLGEKMLEASTVEVYGDKEQILFSYKTKLKNRHDKLIKQVLKILKSEIQETEGCQDVDYFENKEFNVIMMFLKIADMKGNNVEFTRLVRDGLLSICFLRLETAHELLTKACKVDPDNRQLRKLVEMIEIEVQECSLSDIYYETFAEVIDSLFDMSEGLSGTFWASVGLMEFQRNKYSSAIKYYKKALSVYENNPGSYKFLKATTLIGMGPPYIEIEEYSLAEECYKQALNILKGDKRIVEIERARAFNNYGVLQIYMKNYEKAIEYFKLGEELCKRHSELSDKLDDIQSSILWCQNQIKK